MKVISLRGRRGCRVSAGIFGIGALVFTLMFRAAIAVVNGDLRMRGVPAMAAKT